MAGGDILAKGGPTATQIEKAKNFNVDDALAMQTIEAGRTLDNKITLFNGQWADMTIEEIAIFSQSAGYDGLELCTWGNSLDVDRMVGPGGNEYIGKVLDILRAHEQGVWAISGHLVGQFISNPEQMIDEELLGFLPPGERKQDVDNIQLYAVEQMVKTVRAAENFRKVAAEKFGEKEGAERYNPSVITGFTGSPIWHRLYPFPDMAPSRIDQAFAFVAEQMEPVLHVCKQYKKRFALETHPTEIAFDGVTALKLLDYMDKKINGDRFGYNGDGSHLGYQRVDPVRYINVIGGEKKRLYHSHIKDVEWGKSASGLGGVFGSHLPFGHPDRDWDFRSLGRGNLNQAAIMYALAAAGYQGPASIEWEDPNFDREAGAKASQLILRGIVNGDIEMAKDGLKMYTNAANYKDTQFDKAFTAPK